VYYLYHTHQIGQGANQAVEDALVLTECLEEYGFDDHEKALQAYYDRRHERTASVVKISRGMKLRQTEHPWGEWLRDLVLTYVLNSGLFYRLAEEEIITKSPIPWDPSLLRLKEGWQAAISN